jgi:hypothetical protein
LLTLVAAKSETGLQRLQSITSARYLAVQFNNYQPKRLLIFDLSISLLTRNTPRRQRCAPDFEVSTIRPIDELFSLAVQSTKI